MDAKELDDEARQIGDILVSIIKGEERQSEEDVPESRFGDDEGVLAPPYNPGSLLRIYEASSILAPPIAAMVTNIDSFGHDFDPLIDPDGDSAEDQVFAALFIEAASRSAKPKPPTPEEVEARIETLRDEVLIETFRAEAFFEACTVEESFTSLRRRTRQELEAVGNAFWEVIRDEAGQPSQFVLAPAKSMRLTRLGRDFVEIQRPVRTSPLSSEPRRRVRRFRRFVQIVQETKRWFREYGDPRVMSPKTGRFYADVDALRIEEKDATLENANEVIHFRIPFPSSAYGVPRWIHALLPVLGTRLAEEVNQSYFDNKTVPPLALLVSGGRLSKDARDTIRDYLKNEIQGRQNFHKVLVIEGVPADPTGAAPMADTRMRVELKPLRDAQQDDALFLKYSEQNADTVGSVYRISRLLRGDVRDFNRATAQTALEQGEAQVFGPERDDFDWVINQQIMADLDLRVVRFRSRGVQVRDQESVAKILQILAQVGGVVPADIRKLAERVLGLDLPDIDERWATRPLELSTGGHVEEPLMSEEDYDELPEEEPAPPPPQFVPGAAPGPEDGAENEAAPPGPGARPRPPAPARGRGNADDEEQNRARAAGSGSRSGSARAKKRLARKRYSAKLAEALTARGLHRIREQLLEREREAAKESFEKRAGAEEEVLVVAAEDLEAFLASVRDVIPADAAEE